MDRFKQESFKGAMKHATSKNIATVGRFGAKHVTADQARRAGQYAAKNVTAEQTRQVGHYAAKNVTQDEALQLANEVNDADNTFPTSSADRSSSRTVRKFSGPVLPSAPSFLKNLTRAKTKPKDYDSNSPPKTVLVSNYGSVSSRPATLSPSNSRPVFNNRGSSYSSTYKYSDLNTQQSESWTRDRSSDVWKDCNRDSGWTSGPGRGDAWSTSRGLESYDVQECFTPVDEISWSKPTSSSEYSTVSAGDRVSQFSVRACYDYLATMPCDLTFTTGEVIEVLTYTDQWEDWWEGRMGSHVGLFPANFTENL